MLDKTNSFPFNPNGPKVSVRRLRKLFGRFSIEGLRAKERELNLGCEAEALSLENAKRSVGRGK